MLRKILLLGTSCAGILTASAQDATTTGATKDSVKSKKAVVTAYVDAYYRYDFDKMPSNNKTSFTNSQNSFELGMASVKLEHTIGKVGMVADVGFGRRAEEFSYNDANSMLALKQAYVTYAPSSKVKFTAGSWATHVGYELVDPYANKNYSMSYMFSYGPFFHTGVKADVTLGSHNFMVGLVNPTDFKTTDIKFKYLVAQYSTALSSDKVNLYLNYLGGSSSDTTSNSQVDAVVTATVSDKFSIGYNGTMAFSKYEPKLQKSNSTNWWGSALYLNYDVNSWFGLNLRSEIFSDKKMITPIFSPALIGGTVFENTLSANFKIDNLTIIPELRIDNANQAIFNKSTGAATKSTSSFLVAVVYQL